MHIQLLGVTALQRTSELQNSSSKVRISATIQQKSHDIEFNQILSIHLFTDSLIFFTTDLGNAKKP